MPKGVKMSNYTTEGENDRHPPKPEAYQAICFYQNSLTFLSSRALSRAFNTIFTEIRIGIQYGIRIYSFVPIVRLSFYLFVRL